MKGIMVNNFILYSEACSWMLEIKSSCQEIINIVNNFFGGFIIPNNVKGTIETSISINKYDNKYVLSDKNKSYVLNDLSSVGFYLYRIIDKLSESNTKENYCVYHGSVIERDEKSYCVLAPTQTGTSTFISYFLKEGYTCVSDDYIFVDRNTNSIQPFYLPVSLRDTSLLDHEVYNNYEIISGYNELRGESNSLIRFVQCKNKLPFCNAIFISRKNDNSFRRLTKGELFKELLFNLKNCQNLNYELEYTKEISNLINGYELVYNDFNFVKAFLERL